MKIWKSKFGLVWLRYLALLMILIALVANVDIIGKTGAASDVGDIFTFKSLTINGTTYDNSDELIITDGTTLELIYNWELRIPHEATAFDFATIEVPAAFKPPLGDITGRIIVQIDLDETIDVGGYTLSADDNILTFTFNDNILGLDVTDGEIGFSLDFNLKTFETRTIQLVKFADNVGKDIYIALIPDEKASAISKLGVPDTEVDATSITWTIDLVNTVKDSIITDGKLSEVIPAGLVLTDDSIKVYELFHPLNYDPVSPNLTVGEEVLSGYQITNTTEGIDITFDQMLPYAGYRVTFQTTISDFITDTFTNNASLTYDEITLPAAATVGNLTRSDIIEKSGRALNQNEIIWTIDINKAGSQIGEAIIEDLLPAGLTLQADSIKYYQLTRSGDDWNASEILYDDIVTGGTAPTDFPINLGAVADDQAYRITFITDVEYSGDYKKENSFTNTVTLKDGETTRGTDTATVNITRYDILRKTSQSNLDYVNKTITWRIFVNEANHPIGNVVVTDTIPAGLDFNLNDVIVENSSLQAVDLGEGGKTYDPGTRVLTIDLGDLGTEQRNITYTTTIINFEIGAEFVNSAELSGTNVGSGVTATSTSSPDDNSYTKSFRSIDYSAKTIAWQITVNPIKDPITALTITDTFPNKGLFLLGDTVVVTLGGNTLDKNTHYILAPATVDEVAGYQKGFVLTFLGPSLPLNDLVTIDFTTSFDPDQEDIEENTVNGLIRNQARFEGETQNEINIDQIRSDDRQLIEVAWNSGKKEGRRVYDDAGQIKDGWVSSQERQIEWNLYINYLGQNLGTNVSVSDSWDYAGTYVDDSLQIREYTVTAGGAITVTETVLDETKYSFTANTPNEQWWQLVFDGDEGTFRVVKPYVITFRTTVPAISLLNYTNEAIVNALGTEYLYSAPVSYDSYNKFLNKEEAFDRGLGNNALIDQEIVWLVTLNESLSVIQDAVVEDTISAGMVLIEDSIEVFRVENGDNILLEKGANTYSVAISDNDLQALTPTTLRLEFADSYIFNAKHHIKYKTVVVVSSGPVNNSVKFSYDTEEEVVVTTSVLEARQLSWIKGYTGGTPTSLGNLTIKKIDQDTAAPLEASFKLYYKINDDKQYVGETFATDPVSGQYIIEDLPYKTYYLEETVTPKGYQRNKEDIVVFLNQSASIFEVENIKHLTLIKEAVIKDSNGVPKVSFDKIGDVIHYTVTAQNTGTEPLTEVRITDDLDGLVDFTYKVYKSDGTISDAANGSVTLNHGNPGEKLVMTAKYVIGAADLNSGTVNNVAKASGRDTDGVLIEAEEAQKTVTADQESDIQIIKEVEEIKDAGGTLKYKYDQVGDRIIYKFTVTNIGNIRLTDVKIEDALVENVITYLSKDGLPLAGGTTSVALETEQGLIATAVYIVDQNDIDEGSVKNTASVSGKDLLNVDKTDSSDEVVVEAAQNPELTVTKTTEDGPFSSVEDILTYTITVENTGNVTITDISVVDELVGLSETIVSLAPGASRNYPNQTYPVQQSDLNAGSVENVATAEGEDPNGDPVTASGEVTVSGDQDPVLEITKAADVQSYSTLGQVISYTIVVTNNGNVTLTDVAVVDPLIVLNQTIISLAPGGSQTFTGTYTITQADLDRGFLTNTAGATAAGQGPGGTDLTDSDTLKIDAVQTKTINLVKRAVPASYSSLDQVIWYYFEVENTGNVTIRNVRIDDLLLGISGVAVSPAVLEPGQKGVLTYPYAVTQVNLDNGLIVNTATASGVAPDNSNVPSPPSTATATARNISAAVSIKKSADVTSFSAVGDQIIYSFIIQNTEDVTLYNVTLDDVKLGISGLAVVDSLAPGQSETVSAPAYTVTQADIDEGKILNVAVVSAKDPDQNDIDDLDDVTINGPERVPSIALNKTADRQTYSSAGQVINYSFIVVNTGTVTLREVKIDDAKLGITDLAVNPSILAPGESGTASASYTITAADIGSGKVIYNTAEVRGTPSGSDNVTAEDNNTVYYYIVITPAPPIVPSQPSQPSPQPPSQPAPTTPSPGQQQPATSQPPATQSPPSAPALPTQPPAADDPSRGPESDDLTQRTRTVTETTPQDEAREGVVEMPAGSVARIGDFPSNGIATVDDDGNWVYTPRPGFSGEDRFTIIIRNADGSEEEVTLIINVEEPVTQPEGDGRDAGTTISTPRTAGMALASLYSLWLMLAASFVLRRGFGGKDRMAVKLRG